MPERLLIVGAGAQARYVINTIELTQERQICGLLDTFNNPDMWGKEVDGYQVLGGLSALDGIPPASDLKVICAIANLDVKRQAVQLLQQKGYDFCNIIHPGAIIARRVRLGVGNIINARVVVEPGTTICNHTILHAGCVVEHDNLLEDFVNLAPGVTTAGRVKIRNGAVVFTGAALIPDTIVGENAVIAAGAVVIHPVAPHTRVAGVPARPLSAKNKPD